MSVRQLYFTAPRSVVVRTRPAREPGPSEVAVRTRLSAISAGTETLIYRGETASELAADESLETLEGDLAFPLSYGYAAVGEVTAVGDDVADEWLGRRVFGYVPHQGRFVAELDALVPVPDGVSDRDATLLASMETAVNFLLDGEPLVGERVAVFGQGVVGLLTTALLARTPLESLTTVEPSERRRTISEAFGADRSLEPRSGTPTVADGADLTYELSGNPDALDAAISATGFDGRVVVGSWYGTNPTTLELGGRFHRDRIDVRSSQVSTIAPRHEGRWSRNRRHETAWRWLERLELEELFTHRVPVEEASDAYELLESRPDRSVQVLLSYSVE